MKNERKNIQNNTDSMHEDSSERKYEFFSHKECEFFPCHKTSDPDNFNCLFCYCPLYALGPNCGGNYTYLESGFKDCSKCIFPHVKSNYHKILEKYDEIIEVASKDKAKK